MKTSRGAAKGRRRKLACQWHLLQVQVDRCGNYWQITLSEISVKSFWRILSGIARCASKLIYCAVTVLRDWIRVPGEFQLVGVIGRASTIAPLAPGGTGDGSPMSA